MALTAKQEQFARGVALQGLNQSEAYSAAYDAGKMSAKTIADAASKLRAHPDVDARIVVLKERATGAAVKSAALTLEQSMLEVGSLLEDAQQLGQISAGVAAAKLRAQLAGHLVEKKEIRSGPLAEADVDSLTRLRQDLEERMRRAASAESLTGSEAQAAPQPARRVIG